MVESRWSRDAILDDDGRLTAGEASDGLLLSRFVEQWDEAAFRELECRHGPMVLGLCRRILRDAHAAEDALQATFLLLVRKAGSVRKRESVGPWLYGVARRVALEARGDPSRRHEPVRVDLAAPGVDDPDGIDRDELHAALHEELGRLPEKYRAPLVLCYIEGQTHEAVARQLGWPLGTVRGRVARGRDLLGARLTRRGLAPAAVLLALSLLRETEAAVPPRLADATVRAATRVAVGENAPRGDVPVRVAVLERKVRESMQLARLKWATALALGLALTGAAGAALALGPGVGVLAVADDTSRASAELKKLQGTWVAVSSEESGTKNDETGEHSMRFDGETFALLEHGEVHDRGPFRLDPSRDPMAMDITFEEGKMKGKTGRAIYAWDGELLKFCGAIEPKERPTDFTTQAGDDRLLVVLKRQNP
jgi:RNA polymerase sigma-70 factor (ECF subfamily)